MVRVGGLNERANVRFVPNHFAPVLSTEQAFAKNKPAVEQKNQKHAVKVEKELKHCEAKKTAFFFDLKRSFQQQNQHLESV